MILQKSRIRSNFGFLNVSFIVVHGAECAIRPMRHTVIEGVDNVLLELIAAWMGGHHAKPLAVSSKSAL